VSDHRADPAATVSLVVGAGGLLGSAVARDLRRHSRPHATADVPWREHDAAVEALTDAAERLVSDGRPWRLFWCAGSGVVASDQQQLDDEVATLDAFLGRLAEIVTRPGTPPGSVFLASSAGGVYAGSQAPPFTEMTTPRAISPYGHAKLAAEERFREFGAGSGTPVLIGRIANLYGPGQDPRKAQGLITVLCRAHLARRPASIYVSLDTARDYVFVDDVARLACAGADRVAVEPPGTVVVKILASQTGTTVAAILGELRRITKHRPRVVLGASSLARFQARDLRFRSVVWRDLDRLVTTSLPAGMAATMRSAAAEISRPVRVQTG
jgi:UDP-glucose 4-epimerase